MAKRGISQNMRVSQLVDPAVITSDTNGSSVDTQGADSVMINALVGESGDTLSGSVFISLELEESDDNSAWSDVADADMDGATGGGSGQFALIDAAAEDDAVYKVGYQGNKRYVRPVINLTGTHTNGTPIGIASVENHLHAKPVS